MMDVESEQAQCARTLAGHTLTTPEPLSHTTAEISLSSAIALHAWQVC